jgi:hypothetical protein
MTLGTPCYPMAVLANRSLTQLPYPLLFFRVSFYLMALRILFSWSIFYAAAPLAAA